jgi:hypothetical protein
MERRFIAYHEAGHAVVSARLGAPLGDAVLHTRRRWLLGSMMTSGEVGVGDGEVHDEGVDAYLTAAMAGPEVDAQYVHRVFGKDLRRARRAMIRDNRDGDVTNAHDAIVGATKDGDRFRLRTMSQVEVAAQRAVTRYWTAIERVAEELDRTGRLTERQIRRLAA